MPRLFIGTFLTFEEQQKLAAVALTNKHLQEAWQRKPRWVQANKLHLTWLFLGNVDEEAVPKLGTTLSKMMRDRTKILGRDNSKVTVEFHNPEAWPSARKPRMIVLTADSVSKGLQDLATTIRRGLIPFFTEETEQENNLMFRPHVTLLRLDRRIKEIDSEKTNSMRGSVLEIDPRLDVSLIKNLKGALPIRLDINEICLIESNLRRQGDEYKILTAVKI